MINSDEFVHALRANVIPSVSNTHRGLYSFATVAGFSDEFWQALARESQTLTENQRETVAMLIRMAVLDTMSSVLAVLDGERWLEGQTDDLELRWKASGEKLEFLTDCFWSQEQENGLDVRAQQDYLRKLS